MELLLDGNETQKPSDRGKFSPERVVWEQIHQQRYLQWQLGAAIQEIADDEGVTYNAIKHSIQLCEARLPRAQVVEGRNTRLRLVLFDKLHDQYTAVMEGLMADPNPIVRLKALDSFRKTMATEPATGVQVNTQVNVANQAGRELLDFETSIARLKESQKAAHRPFSENP